jgi:lipopolysaccharide transport system ATP-binding protein
MSNILIKAENISKHYRLGRLGSNSVKEDIRNWWRKTVHSSQADLPDIPGKKTGHLWALRDINFEVSQGEVLGVVGKNGAGKSTLLKIISRITLPTTGRIRGKGRTASLLEVGTGFHNELTGRENIYLNGHIMGMKKKEIDRKFEEIVEFSGVERFLDTPVKRYSSGMYVRLAFAVAANLDPEILIVDEVLAVGDSEFQKKCLGKMKEVSSQEGKTILFVSHNMQAMRNLCQRTIVLDKGSISDMGDPDTVISRYLKNEKSQNLVQDFADIETAPGNEFISVNKIRLSPQYVNGMDLIDIRTPLLVNFAFWYKGSKPIDLIVGIHLFNFAGECIFDLGSEPILARPGLIIGECLIPGNFLNDGSYYISIVFVKDSTIRLYYYENCISFDVEDYRENSAWFGKWIGYVRPKFPIRLEQVKSLNV